MHLAFRSNLYFPIKNITIVNRERLKLGDCRLGSRVCASHSYQGLGWDSAAAFGFGTASQTLHPITHNREVRPNFENLQRYFLL